MQSSGFTERFVRLNNLHRRGFKDWLFQAGMGFTAAEKWWSDHGARPTGHQGVDFAAFLDDEKREHRLEAGLLVPPLFNGKVVQIVDDLLGRTIIVDHAIRDQDDLVLHAFYAHLTPHGTISQGAEIGTDSILGAIAPGRTCPAHLHISTAWLARDLSLGKFSWQTSSLQFFDPLEII
jgi:murein DD-endopeptidase MepM/ murein hydrolase activator NlpD